MIVFAINLLPTFFKEFWRKEIFYLLGKIFDISKFLFGIQKKFGDLSGSAHFCLIEDCQKAISQFALFEKKIDFECSKILTPLIEVIRKILALLFF